MKSVIIVKVSIKSIILLFLYMSDNIYGQVGVGTSNPDPSAILELKAVNRGFLPPRLTETQMNNIQTPSSGLIVYCSNCCTGTGRLTFYNGSEWKELPLCNFAPSAALLSIGGTTQVGEVLSASFTYIDSENDAAGIHTYQWYRADNNIGLNRVAIAGATDSLYSLVAADNGKFIQFEVTPVASSGTLSGVATSSSYVGVITNSVPTPLIINNSSVTVTGDHFSNDLNTLQVYFNNNLNDAAPTDDGNDDHKMHHGTSVSIPLGQTYTAAHQVKLYWYHPMENKNWGVYIKFFNGAVQVGATTATPSANLDDQGNQLLTATSTGNFNTIVVGAIDKNGGNAPTDGSIDGGKDARIREIELWTPSPNSQEVEISIN
ncbi:MAG: hypothetical protein N4A45_01510 [Flavobacteriales bacterium]|jgi:hypothetical protein|nr:hypothetical protein [Flavobacteriales bacterium]